MFSAINVKQSLWKHICIDSNGRHLFKILQGYKPTRCSYFWKSIHKARAMFKIASYWKLGAGKLISFWHDTWCGDSPLYLQYPVLYMNAINKDCTVDSQYSPQLREWVVELTLNNASHELSSLMQQIQSEAPSSGHDIIKWVGTSNKEFSVRSCYQWFMEGGCVTDYPTDIWKNKVPLKLKIFIWLAIHNRVPTKDVLLHRNINIADASCVLCGMAEETVDHLFLQCIISQSIWSHFMTLLGLQLPQCSFRDMWVIWRREQLTNRHRFVWDLVAMAICSSLWEERNMRIFSNKYSIRSCILRNINANIISWTGLMSSKRRRKADAGIQKLKDAATTT
jgi:hypothetical protein